MLKLVPAYTLETLDKCSLERLLGYYFWDYRSALSNKYKEENNITNAGDIVYRDGKPYKKVNDAKWL